MKSRMFRTACVVACGAVAGASVLWLLIVFKLDQSPATGERTVLGHCADWVSGPFGLVMRWARHENLMEPDNVPIVLTGLSAYWALLGAVVALIGHWLWRFASGFKRVGS